LTPIHDSLTGTGTSMGFVPSIQAKDKSLAFGHNYRCDPQVLLLKITGVIL